MKSFSRSTIRFLAIGSAVPIGLLTLAIAFGGPSGPPPLSSVNDPFAAVDFSDLPVIERFTSRDGSSLAYRRYGPSGQNTRGSVVLIHGSSASSNSMHVLAKAFADAGYSAYALDVRGHGASGTKGTISYVGQLEDDLDAFLDSAAPPNPRTLVGFSSGGGFVLRFAGSTRQDRFENYLLLSPYLSQEAPNYRAASGGWVSLGLPRVVAISALNAIHVRAFNDLPVIAFALNEKAKSFLTPQYSFALAANFQPQRDYKSNIRAVHQPVAVLAGSRDELFETSALQSIFRSQGKPWPVTLLPGVGHISLTLDPFAARASVAAVEKMQAQRH